MRENGVNRKTQSMRRGAGKVEGNMKNTVLTLQKQKEEHDKIVMVTAYDYTTAKIMDEAGVNTILVGDSLGMVMLGYEDTLSVTMEDMIHHTAAVSRGAKDAFVVADMPFMSYQTSVYDAVVNAGRLMKEVRRKSRTTQDGRPRECGKAGRRWGICTAHCGNREGSHSGCGAHRTHAAVRQRIRWIQGTGQRCGGSEKASRRREGSGSGRCMHGRDGVRAGEAGG